MERLRDITGDIGPLYSVGDAKIPMYSFDKPSFVFWQAAYDAMRTAGRSDEEAIEWLQSKGPRHALDGWFESDLRMLGEKLGRAAVTGMY